MSFMDTGSTARAARELLAAELIVSRPDPRDRRRQVLTLSQKGADTFDQAFEQRRDYLRQLLEKVEKSAVALASDDIEPFTDV